MKKNIIINISLLPNEIDDLERLLIDLNRASKYIDGNDFSFSVHMITSPEIIEWERSTLTESFFSKKFFTLKKLTEWAKSSNFEIDDEILGSLSAKIKTYETYPDATHFLWLDPDICFDETLLYYISNSIDNIESSGFGEYLITPELVKLWDSTWDCMVNEKFKDKSKTYHKENNPFQDAGKVGEVTLETVSNNIPNQPSIKYGAGFSPVLSKKLLDRINIPKSMGHYGYGDDTFMMWAIDKVNKNGGEIQQFKLKNYVVCENYTYRNRSYYNDLLSIRNRTQEFREIANSKFKEEYSLVE